MNQKSVLKYIYLFVCTFTYAFSSFSQILYSENDIRKKGKIAYIGSSGSHKVLLSNIEYVLGLEILCCFNDTFPDDAYKFKHIQYFYNSSNKIGNIEKLINNAPDLQFLYIRFSRLSSFPTLQSNSALQKAVLIGNYFKHIPPNILLSSKLVYLDISYQKADTFFVIPANKNTTLEYLDLAGNNLSGIENISAFTRLKTLKIPKTKINEVPDDLCNLTELNVLDLSDNPIEKLPECFGNLTKLKELNLSATKIKKLPASMQNLKEMSVLDLRGTGINEFPEVIFSMPFLAEVRADGLFKHKSMEELIQISERLEQTCPYLHIHW